MSYTITSKGRAVLRSATFWGLSSRLQALLAFCDPRVSPEDLRQFMPPVSLQNALFALRELELIDGPPVAASAAPAMRERGGSCPVEAEVLHTVPA
jgi:hypothetical protein